MCAERNRTGLDSLHAGTLSSCRRDVSQAGLSGSAMNSVRTTEQKPMSDEARLRELNPFKSPK